MKLIIIEGTDNTGKDTVINNIIKRYSTNNITPIVIHCEKPKSSNWAAAAAEQDEMFINYANNLVNYNDDVVIFNRAWYGEYVYGCMYRNRTNEDVKHMITEVEDRIDICNTMMGNTIEVYYIQLISTSAQLLVNNDDGKSISDADTDAITEEIRRFMEIFEYSKINKLLVKVNIDDEFRPREDIMNDVNNFLK